MVRGKWGECRGGLGGDGEEVEDEVWREESREGRG